MHNNPPFQSDPNAQASDYLGTGMSYLQIAAQKAKDNAAYAADIARQQAKSTGIDQYAPDTKVLGDSLYTNAEWAKNTASSNLGGVQASYNDGTLGTKAQEKAGAAYGMFAALGGSLIS